MTFLTFFNDYDNERNFAIFFLFSDANRKQHHQSKFSSGFHNKRKTMQKLIGLHCGRWASELSEKGE